MANENEILNNEIENQEEEVNAIDIITDLRANTVPKDKYNKLVADNQKLMKALANGETIAVEAPKTPDITELRKNWMNYESKKDVEIAQDILNIRNALLEAGEPDPFLPNGKGAEITDQDYIDAERVAELLKNSIELSNGDNGVFIAKLSSQLVDTTLPRGNGRGTRFR